MFPLYALALLNFTALAFETDDLGERIATTSTFFLAAFAMLYVVGEHLPKTDFLTIVDQVIVVTTCSLFLMGLGSCIIFFVHRKFGEELAQQVNWGFGIFLTACILYSLTLFHPLRKRQQVAVANSMTPERKRNAVAKTTNSDFMYAPLAQIKTDPSLAEKKDGAWLARRHLE